ncbi:hypothetical protein F5050DRAFT_1716404, partial [Lentinula boryana]
MDKNGPKNGPRSGLDHDKENKGPPLLAFPSPEKKKLKNSSKKRKNIKPVESDVTTAPLSTPAKPAAKQCVCFSAEDDRTMVDVLLEQKADGFATDNGGWKEPALKAVVNALVGSEAVSGGTPKTGWDSENHCVQTTDEQWDAYLTEHCEYEKYHNATFPLYDDLDELLNGALATGKSAFYPGKGK